MLLILLTVIFAGLITYLYFKPLISDLFYSVPYEPKYIRSYVPFFGYGLKMRKDPIEFIRFLYLKYGKTFAIYLRAKRFVYLYDEQTFLTKVLKSPDLSTDEVDIDLLVNGFGVSRQCVMNEDIQEIQIKQYHQYLVGDELDTLNKRVHESLIKSMKLDAKSIQHDQTKIVNLFEHFAENLFYVATESLFGHSFATEQRNASPDFYKLFQAYNQAFELDMLRIPFRTIFYKSTFEDRLEFVKRFSSLKLDNGESKLIHAREELYRSDKYKYLFTEYDIGALQAMMLWGAMINTPLISCWIIVDLLLHPEALEAVKQELKENMSSPTLVYDKETLTRLEILESCINESMRRMRDSISIRSAIRNTTIECLDQTKIGLRKGDMLVYPSFLKHFDPNLFGPNPFEYQYDRFVKKPNQPKAPSLMLFGSGSHMCPGRYWAMAEIKMFIFLIIEHMNIEFINMTDQDREDFRKRLPHDYSKVIGNGGPKKGYEHKFDIKYSYKNFDIE